MKKIHLVFIVLQSTLANAQYFQSYFNYDVAAANRANYRPEVLVDGLCTRQNYTAGDLDKYSNVGVGYTISAHMYDATAQSDELRFIKTTKTGSTVNQNYGYAFAKNGSTAWLHSAGHSICEIDNGLGTGGYIAVGLVASNSITGSTVPGGADALVTKITSGGAATNKYRFDFGGADEFNCVIASQSDPGYFIACGTSKGTSHSKVIVMKFDAAMNPVWSKMYHFDPGFSNTLNNFCIGKAIAEDPTTGELFVVGSYYYNGDPTNQNALIMKLNPVGDIQFARELDLNGGNQEELRAIKPTDDKNLIIAGFTNGESGTAGWDSWLIKMDTLGTIIFDKILRHHYSSGYDGLSKATDVIERINDQGTAEYYLAGLHGDAVGVKTNSICKTDNNGIGIAWYNYQQVYPYNDHQFGIDYATTTMSAPGIRLFGNMLNAGLYSDSYMMHSYFNGATCSDYCPGDNVTTIDESPESTPLERKTIDNYKRFSLAVQRTAYNNYQICSQTKVDCGSNAKISADDEEAIPSLKFKINPNPASTELGIQIVVPDVNDISVYLMDVTGRKFRSIAENQKMESGIHLLNVNCSDIPSGIYLCEIQTGDIIQTQKIIIQH